MAIAALGAALWGHGWVTGRHGEQLKLEAFQARIDALGQAQAEHTAQVVKQQKEITKNVSKDYRRRLAAVTPASVPDIHPGGSAIAELSCPAPGIDGKPADSLPPVPAVAKADFDELKTLAAQTTLVLIKLQDWVRQQQEAFR